MTTTLPIPATTADAAWLIEVGDMILAAAAESTDVESAIEVLLACRAWEHQARRVIGEHSPSPRVAGLDEVVAAVESCQAGLRDVLAPCVSGSIATVGA